jgi:hypothetical protein
MASFSNGRFAVRFSSRGPIRQPIAVQMTTSVVATSNLICQMYYQKPNEDIFLGSMKQSLCVLLFISTYAAAQVSHNVGIGFYQTFAKAQFVNANFLPTDPVSVVNPFVNYELGVKRWVSGVGVSYWRDRWRFQTWKTTTSNRARYDDMITSTVTSIAPVITVGYKLIDKRRFVCGIKVDGVARVPIENEYIVDIPPYVVAVGFGDTVIRSAPLDRSPAFGIGGSGFIAVPWVVTPKVGFGYLYDATGFRHNVALADAIYDGFYATFSLSYEVGKKRSRDNSDTHQNSSPPSR